MGTRGLLGFVIRGKRKGTYIHFDCYPEGLGVEIVRFILALTPEDRQKMIEQLDKLVWVESTDAPAQDLKERYLTLSRGYLNLFEREAEQEAVVWKEAGATDDEIRKQQEHRARFTTGRDDWYEATRKFRELAAALKLILTGELEHLPDQTDFAQDGVFCEWAYWIDFETETLTVEGAGNLPDGTLLSDGSTRRWAFAELSHGFWKTLIDEIPPRDRSVQPSRDRQYLADAAKIQREWALRIIDARQAPADNTSAPRAPPST